MLLFLMLACVSLNAMEDPTGGRQRPRGSSFSATVKQKFGTIGRSRSRGGSPNVSPRKVVGAPGTSSGSEGSSLFSTEDYQGWHQRRTAPLRSHADDPFKGNADGKTFFHLNPDVERARELLLEQSADISVLKKQDNSGRVPLHYAETPQLVALCLELAPDQINREDFNGRTPIFFANANTVSLLIAAGASVKFPANRKTPLHEAQNVEVARALIAAGADPNAQDPRGNTVLHTVTSREMLEFLVIDCQVDRTIVNNDKQTAVARFIDRYSKEQITMTEDEAIAMVRLLSPVPLDIKRARQKLHGRNLVASPHSRRNVLLAAVEPQASTF